MHKKVNPINDAWILAHPYDQGIYVTNIYIRSWHVPCYKCVKSPIAGKHRTDGFITANIIDRLCKVDNDLRRII
ncbi:hypothetical protein EFR94_04860 [Levilactobacillus brevis]|nr:hypothetical protein [Levilactobacillus brevis]